MILDHSFFDRYPLRLAPALLGKVLRHRYEDPKSGDSVWLAVQIIETEAYYRREKGSHSSLGYTAKRKAMFMSPGTIYMYFARGGDSLNFSARGPGNAVLIKAGIPYFDETSPAANHAVMLGLNPRPQGQSSLRLCSGQTLLCKSLGLKVRQWDQRQLEPGSFCLEDTGYTPGTIIQCARLGIPAGRDEHLPYRFIDRRHAACATRNPLTQRKLIAGEDYHEVETRAN